jgi:putative ABC transport system permease protein
MKASKSFRLALNMLFHSKLRSWLTIIGIVIGVAAVVAIISIGEGMRLELESRLGGLGADLITVSPGASRAMGFLMVGPSGGGGGNRQFTSSFSEDDETENLTVKDINVIKSVGNVAVVVGAVSGRGDAYYLGEKASVSIQGVEPLGWNEITTSELETGRFLTPSDYNSVVVGSSLANDMFKQPLAINRMITIEGKSFKIVGILQESGSSMGGSGNDNAVIMPIDAARDLLDDVGDEEFDSITVKVDDEDFVEDTAAAIDERLMVTRHATERTKDYTVSSMKATQETISSTMESAMLFLAAIAMVSLLVGAIGIANTMFTTVLEKTRDIGIMKAIGARNSDIMSIFLMNSALVGIVGGLIGIAVGSAASLLLGAGGALPMTRMMGMGTVVTPQILAYGLLIAIGVSIGAGVIPAYRASRLRPVDALRYE